MDTAIALRPPANRAGVLSVLRARREAANQRSKFLLWQGCELKEAGVQALELAFGDRVEVDAANTLLDTRALQPTKKNLGTRIRDRTLAQATFDLASEGGSGLRRVARNFSCRTSFR
jgi:hypothetical protein